MEVVHFTPIIHGDKLEAFNNYTMQFQTEWIDQTRKIGLKIDSSLESISYEPILPVSPVYICFDSVWFH